MLKKYKNAISSDIVTGKIDIRGIEIPEYEFVEENIDTETDESMEGMDGRTSMRASIRASMLSKYAAIFNCSSTGGTGIRIPFSLE